MTRWSKPGARGKRAGGLGHRFRSTQRSASQLEREGDIENATRRERRATKVRRGIKQPPETQHCNAAPKDANHSPSSRAPRGDGARPSTSPFSDAACARRRWGLSAPWSSPPSAEHTQDGNRNRGARTRQFACGGSSASGWHWLPPTITPLLPTDKNTIAPRGMEKDTTTGIRTTYASREHQPPQAHS